MNFALKRARVVPPQTFTIMPNRDCILCKGNNHQTLYGGYAFDNSIYAYLRCCRCGLVFCSPMPPVKTLSKFYARTYNYSWFVKRKNLKKIQAWHRARRVKKFIPANGKTLDVGCGHGFFVNSLSVMGYNSFGYEYSARSEILAKGKNIFYAPLLTDIPEGRFDFITAWHAIEHMFDPTSILDQISSKLDKS